MTLAILTIGTSTNRINLLDLWGFHVQDWTPTALNHSGIWQTSPFSAGRQQVYYSDDNIVDTFSLILRQKTQDAVIQATRDLRQMLRAAIDYWLPGDRGLEPVYLEARASCETHSRYAVVRDARLATDSNPYSEPFVGATYCVMQDLTLSVEHGPWVDQKPGDTSCVEVSGAEGWYISSSVVTSEPAASNDDAWVYASGAEWGTGQTYLPLGNYRHGPVYTGIRFVNVNVPHGAVILDAYVTFEATDTDSGDPCVVLIFGEDVDSANGFTTLSDFSARLANTTDAYVGWGTVSEGIRHWTAGGFYNTPNLGTIIQEIVDRPGWAANNELVLFFLDRDSNTGAVRRAASFDHKTAAPPQLTVTYATPAQFGRAATCANEVYVGNKHNVAQLTHAFIYDSDGGEIPGNWSSNLIEATTPFEFFPNLAEDGDCCYFGINTATVDSGPFASIVFDIGTVAAYSGTAWMTWEYWDGTAWATLLVVDNTAELGSGALAFTRQGVNSVHWTQPADWATVAVNGVTGYWVRARLVATSGGMSPPTQDNRSFYTIVWPCVSIAADQVGGDVPALAYLRVENKSDPGGDGRHADRLLLGLRSTSRGNNFTPFLNLADEQNRDGVFLTFGIVADDVTTPTGRRVTWTPSAPTAMSRRATLMIQNPLTAEYSGTYHAYLRARQQGGTAGDITVQLAFQTGYGSYPLLTPIRSFAVINQWQLLDFGRVTLPPDDIQDIALEYIMIDVQAATTAGAGESLYLCDLILFPVDEGAWEFQSQARGDASASTNTYTCLNIDSATYPKAMIRAYDEWAPDSYWSGLHLPWRSHAPGPLFLQANREQRLWFLAGYQSSGNEYSPGETAWRVQLFKLQRYLSMRGAG